MFSTQSPEEWQRREESRERDELRREALARYADDQIPDGEPEPECACVQVAADEFDARHCPAHGPHSAIAQLAREAEDESAYWSSPGWEQVFASMEKK